MGRLRERIKARKEMRRAALENPPPPRAPAPVLSPEDRAERMRDRMNAPREMHRVCLPQPASATPAPGPISDAQAEADFIRWREGGCIGPCISKERPPGRPNLFLVPKP